MITLKNIRKAHTLHSEDVKKSTEFQLARIIEKALLKRGFISEIGIEWFLIFFIKLTIFMIGYNKDYIAVGKEPGTPKLNLTSKACPIEGELGC